MTLRDVRLKSVLHVDEVITRWRSGPLGLDSGQVSGGIAGIELLQ